MCDNHFCALHRESVLIFPRSLFQYRVNYLLTDQGLILIFTIKRKPYPILKLINLRQWNVAIFHISIIDCMIRKIFPCHDTIIEMYDEKCVSFVRFAFLFLFFNVNIRTRLKLWLNWEAIRKKNAILVNSHFTLFPTWWVNSNHPYQFKYSNIIN